MLTGLYRDGPLRQRIRKGYVIVARQPAEVAQHLARRAPAGHGWSVRFDDRNPATVWVDTGFVCLHSPQARARVARRLGDGVAALAGAARKAHATLLPSAQLVDGPTVPGWLCADLHALEVLGDVQREISTNLLRQHSPLLIALTGRAAFGVGAGSPQGSRRLAEATDQLTTRYIHSFAPTHLARVKESLSRDDGVSRLDLMDVSPLSEPVDGIDTVELRLCDAQLLVSTTMAHALLSQALTMRAGKLVREGRRVGATPHALLDQNRSQAVVRGLSARLASDARPDRTADRRGKDSGPGKNSGPGKDSGPSVVAGDAVLRLMKDLVPEFRALDATFEELSPLVLGLSLEAVRTAAIRNENDLLQHWRRHRPRELEPEHVAARLRDDPAWLLVDHLSEANRRAAPGAASVVAMNWTRWLAGETDADDPAGPTRKKRSPAQKPAAGSRPRHAGGGDQARRRAFATLLAALEEGPAEGENQSSVLLRTYLRAGGATDLDRELRGLDRERAKQLRRRLRPPRDRVVASGSPPPSWEGAEAARACRLARDRGHALLAVEVAATESGALSSCVRDRLRDCPEGVAAVLLATATYRSEAGQRAKTELVVIGLGEEGSS